MAQQLRVSTALAGIRFDFQHSYSCLQPPVTPVLGDPVPSSGLVRHQACTWYMPVLHMQANTHTSKMKISKLFSFCCC